MGDDVCLMSHATRERVSCERLFTLFDIFCEIASSTINPIITPRTGFEVATCRSTSHQKLLYLVACLRLRGSLFLFPAYFCR
jgi:hypothetical protein